MDPSLAQWLAFYQEGSLCNPMTPSPWWNRWLECRYYLHRITPDVAQKIWDRTTQIKEQVLYIQDVLGRYKPLSEMQLSLF